ncbi:MAG: tubulin/FtsZ family protein [Methanomicrobiales archaeon]|nr:tubulin/FtsZ family protein [Methanomicrobiales archaeon]
MRILAIGLGGAGARIVDTLYGQDLQGSIHCMAAIAVDFDADTLQRLKFLPPTGRIHFPPIDPTTPYDVQTTIDIEEVMTQIQQVDTIEIDSILLFAGLGGSMVDAAPLIIPELRKSFIEPVFAVVTLPCSGEGKKRSAKAADDIERLKPLVDSVILFDNETWYRKIKDELAITDEKVAKKEIPKRLAKKILSQPLNRKEYIHNLLNTRIARQMALILHAGEFSETGVEVGEVVLDAGEVLNTLVGMGYVAIGYAAESLPGRYLNFLNRWRPASYFIQNSQNKASRIVSLAKKAIYEEVSIPCDLTSADKALVLIAGPSQELSMRGFQTVRKWIDRSIAGLEMRSGDYPIQNTRYVGIIIMLSGMHNIPRLDELAQAREEYRVEMEQEGRRTEEELPGSVAGPGGVPVEEVGAAAAVSATGAAAGEMKDRMITVPGSRKAQKGGRPAPLFEGLNMSLGKVRGIGETQGREGGVPADITRKTVVKGGQAPKDTVFGLKDIRVERGTGRTADGSSSAGVPRATKPREESLGPGEIRSGGKERARDSAFTTRNVQVRETGIRPIDSTLLTPGKGKVPAAGKARELDPGKRRSEILEPPATGKEAGAPGRKPRARGKKDDEEIGWIH